ncbi:MAG: NAD(P)H-dependent oxidoreductase [Rhodobacterales bacterium]|nr:NAD(P)H-dependent oxidoreductase [Rhodobacterales bacterium]NCT13615.1 NAD(P)H-dependent oxidoreductase [Rhodobacterales bacterium]
MRILVIFCHPSDASFGAAIHDVACRTLRAQGHELRIHDLYAEGFDPVLTRQEWEQYLTQPDRNIASQQQHVDDLRWAEGLVVIYPTWFFGPPAMLKGWLEKVWLPGVTFEVATVKGRRPRPLLQNIRLFVGITTSGSPWWWIRLIRDPGRSLFTRGLRVTFAARCRFRWAQLYNMNTVTDADRKAFLARVERMLQRL